MVLYFCSHRFEHIAFYTGRQCMMFKMRNWKVRKVIHLRLGSVGTAWTLWILHSKQVSRAQDPPYLRHKQNDSSCPEQHLHLWCVCVCVCVCSSRVWLFATPCTLACQAPLSMGFPREEYKRGLPFPLPGDLLNSEVETSSPALTGSFFTSEPPGKPLHLSRQA